MKRLFLVETDTAYGNDKPYHIPSIMYNIGRILANITLLGIGFVGGQVLRGFIIAISHAIPY